MAEKKKYNSILISGRKDETLTYSRYIKDEESGESVKETLDKKVNVSDELETHQIKDGAITKDKLQDKTIGVEKLDNELRQTIAAATGLPEDLVETIQNVDDTLKDHQSQLDDKQQQITANDEDISLLQTRSTQMEETIKSIAATGGASQATAVTYNNEKSKLTAVNIQSAVDEVVDKTAIKDEEGTLVETPFRYIQNEEFIFAKVDAEDKLLFGIHWDGTPEFGKTSALEDRLQSQVTLLAERVATIMGDEDTTNVIDTMNELKKFFAEIENTQTLTSILANLDKTTIKDEEGNVLDSPFRVISNEEFILAVVDSENRVLFGIYRATGKPYCPLNDMYHISHSEDFLWVILDAANHPLLGIQQDGTCWAAKAQWLDDIKAIKEALSSIDETLKTFQPKEDGKGLINLDVADSFFYISNDEYIIAVVDAKDRILAGIKYDAQPYFPNHEMYSVITNDEWLYAIIDAEDKVLGGFRADDGHMIVGGVDISTFIANVIIDVADIKKRIVHLSTIENDEYLSIETDAEGKVIGYVAPDGSHYLYKVKSETIDAKVDKEEGKSLIDEDVADAHSTLEDPEGRTEITTDSDGKIMSYRDSSGKKHEYAMEVTNLEVSNLNLKGNSVNDIGDALKANDFKLDSPSDFSKDSYVELPIPRVAAQVRIYASKLPTTKQDDIEAEIEYNDKDGNYFRKPVILNSQGSSSMSYIDKETGERGNIAIDINDGSKIKFGDFPTQDSFHLKKYYIDIFRGQCIVGYWLMEQVYQTRPIGKRYPYEMLSEESNPYTGDGKADKDFYTGAKCHPDGFPVIITWISTKTKKEKNIGIYAWNLKKSKEVYHVNKKTPENIILDGVINDRTLFGGSVDWTQFEIRNPKSLIDIDGNKYDGDNPNELSETDKNSKKVKDYIIRLSGAKAALAGSNNKETFEKYFIVDAFIDYFIVSQILYHLDGFSKNWIWGTWNGLQWAPTLYDVDSIWGAHWAGTFIVKGSDIQGVLGTGRVLNLDTLYADEIIARYKELRDLNVISVDNIVNLLKTWLDRIGYDNLEKEISLYSDIPSYRDPQLNEGWEIVDYSSLQNDYSSDKTYSIGDTCVYKNYKFKAIKEIINVPPLKMFYEHAPRYCGFYNSIKRVSVWLTNRISFLDKTYKYNI